MPIDWSSGLAVAKLCNHIQNVFRRRKCPVCGSHDTDAHVVNLIGTDKYVIVLACWDCGSAQPISKLRGVSS